MSIYSKLEGIRQLSNSSLTSIIDVTNLNFKSLSEANIAFLNNIKYDESANSLSVNKGTFKKIDVTDLLSFTLDGIPTFTINSQGRAEGQELLVVVSESQRHRFTDFNDWPEVGVPGEVIYTGVQNQRPEFGEDFIGYLDGRGWVSLTNLTAPVQGIFILPEAGSPLIIPTVPNGQGLIWIGPPGSQTAYEPVNNTVYFTDDEGNTFDILQDFAWEIIGNDAKFKPTGKAIIGDISNPGKFQFVDNNEQAGYILHADGAGNAYWGPNLGSGGPGPANYSYWEIKDYLADVTQTVYHNLQTLNVVVDLIDVTTNEKVEGHVDNYQTNSIDVTLVEDNPNVKVVVLGAGGIGGGGVLFLSELNDVTLTSPILDGDVLTYDIISGTWINAPAISAGGETLAQTLNLGNLTGGIDIIADIDSMIRTNNVTPLNRMALQLFNDTTDYMALGSDLWAANLKGGSVQLYNDELYLGVYSGVTQQGVQISLNETLKRITVKANNLPSGTYDWRFDHSVNVKMQSPNAAAFYADFTPTNLTGNRTYTFQNRDGTVAFLSDIPAPTQAGHVIYESPSGTPFTQRTKLVFAGDVTVSDVNDFTYGAHTRVTIGGTSSIQTPDDKFLNAITTVNDGDLASNGSITNTPVDGCYVEVRINGTEYEVGNGVDNKVCYFADPNGSPIVPRGFSSSHPNGQVQAGDKLYWNGSNVGFQLLNGWRVSFHYLTY